MLQHEGWERDLSVTEPRESSSGGAAPKGASFSEGAASGVGPSASGASGIDPTAATKGADPRAVDKKRA